MKYLTLIVLLSFSVSLLASEKPVLKYDPTGSNSWIPYYIKQSDNPGIIGELIPLLLSDTHIKGIKVDLPAARMKKALEVGDIDFDIISPSWLSEQEQQSYLFSEPIMAITEYIVRLKKDNLPILDKNAYLGKEVGTVRGYYYHDDELFKRVDFSSERELVLALAKERVSLAILGGEPALYWSKQLNVPLDLTLTHSQCMLHLRIRKEHARLLVLINASIKSLKAQGVISQLLDKYLSTYKVSKPNESN